MQSFWDLLPASLWPTQPFIPPDENTRAFLTGMQGGRLGALFGGPAGATDQATNGSGILGPALTRSALGDDQLAATQQLATGVAQAAPPASIGELGTRLPAVGAAAVRPLTDYLPTQGQYARDGVDEMREGWRNLTTRHADEMTNHMGVSLSNLKGIAQMGLGVAGYLGSPVNAAIHTIIGQPIEDATGLPSKDTDFAAGLALPFAKRVPGMSAPPVAAARVPAVTPAAVADAPQYTREQANLIRNWLGIEPERFRGTVNLDPPALKGQLLDEHATPIGAIERSISPDTGMADHGFLSLEPRLQGAGFAKDILRSNIDFYRQLGLSGVETWANADAGGYVWAKYGFVPTAKSWDTLRASLKSQVSRPTLDIAPADRQAMLDLLENRDPRTIWRIADYQTPVMVGNRSMPLGKHLLLGSGWDGNLDLSDAAAMNRFDAYVGAKK